MLLYKCIYFNSTEFICLLAPEPIYELDFYVSIIKAAKLQVDF